jgi:hypothetical protein
MGPTGAARAGLTDARAPKGYAFASGTSSTPHAGRRLQGRTDVWPKAARGSMPRPAPAPSAYAEKQMATSTTRTVARPA